MKLEEMVLEKSHHGIVTVNEMQFGFIPKEEQLMLCLSLRGCKMSIMLKE